MAPILLSARLRRSAGAAFGLVIVSSLALSGCSSQPAVGSASDPQFDAAWQQKKHASFYSQSIDWRPCTAEDGLDEQIEVFAAEAGIDTSTFECATVEAPMNWTDPGDDRTIELAISRIPATGDPAAASPMFTNPGGPGIGGVQHSMLMATSTSFAPVREAYELWGFDPRGVGGSTPAQCESTSEIAAVQLAECAQENPVAHYMGTSQVARDLDMLRALSGAKQLDYLGYSYGTMLGATYATLFPEKAGRMVLDSAENAQWGTLNHNYDQQVAVAKAVGALADSCPKLVTIEGDPVTCPFTSEREMLDYKASLDQNPMTATDGTRITGAELRSFLTSALYGDSAGQLDLLGRARSGDQSAIDELGAQVAGGGAEIDTTGQLIVCPSVPKTPDVAGLVDHINEVGIPEFLGGPELTDDLLSEFTELECSALTETGTDITTRFDASKVANPLLVIGITGDHATPYQHSKELASQLGKAAFLTLDGIGHGASFSDRSTCIDEAATAYLLDGTLPAEGTVCTADTEA